MRWTKVALGVAALGAFVAQAANAEVPSFVRQTGLACNNCHMTWTPNPDMTFTGTKFRLNAYRTPWVAERIEAGEEGALNGRRLVLGVDGYLSFHMRSNLLSQSKSTSDPAGPERSANAVRTAPFASLAWDYTGPIAENIGIWTEWYSTNEATDGNVHGLVKNDEYDVKMAFNPGGGGNIVGIFMNNQSRYNPFFGAYSSGVTQDQRNAGGPLNYVHIGAYGWFNDRVAISLDVEPGEDNTDYRRMNYGWGLALLPLNTDATWLMLSFFGKAGNDMVPQISSYGFSPDGPFAGTRTTDYIRGISATRAGGAAYASSSMGDGTRLLFDVSYGFVDKGPWSINSHTAISLQDETYSDGATSHLTGFSTSWRVFYERTYGLLLQFGKDDWEFVDASGIVHDSPNDIEVDLGFVYRMAMNFAWELTWGNSQSRRLDQNWRNGWSWNLRWHFLY